MVYKNIVKKIVDEHGKSVLVQITYDRCNVYYNPEEGSFWYQPYDITHEEFFGEPPSGLWERLGYEETTLDKAQPFTDMMDAIKYMFGHKEFHSKRMQALWDAYLGKHDIFGSKVSRYFFPVNYNNKNN